MYFFHALLIFVILMSKIINQLIISKMKYLITGGAGFLGINLVRYLHSRGHEITSLDIVDFDYPDMKDKIKIITVI